MNSLLQNLQGKKTHLTCVLLIALLALHWKGWLVLPTEVYGVLVGLALMFLRAGVTREISDQGAPATDAKAEAPKSPVNLAGGGRFGLLSIFAAGIGVIFLSGCTTTTTTTPAGQTVTTTMLDTNAVISAIQNVVPAAVKAAVNKDPNCGPYLKQVAVLFRAAAMRGDFDPKMIQDSLSQISIKELRTDEAALAEQAALGLYQAFAAQVVSQKLDQVVWLRPVLDALSRAIVAGLPKA